MLMILKALGDLSVHRLALRCPSLRAMTISPCITHTIRRFGNWMLSLIPPQPDTHYPA